MTTGSFGPFFFLPLGLVWVPDTQAVASVIDKTTPIKIILLRIELIPFVGRMTEIFRNRRQSLSKYEPELHIEDLILPGH